MGNDWRQNTDDAQWTVWLPRDKVVYLDKVQPWTWHVSMFTYGGNRWWNQALPKNWEVVCCG